MPESATQKQLDRIENAIIGNGTEGLLARTARIEERLVSAASEAEDAKTTALETAKTASSAIERAEVQIMELTSAVKSHVGTDHLSVMMKKKEFWAIIFILYVALHLIATYVPNVWDWIMVLLGIPKLLIPLN